MFEVVKGVIAFVVKLLQLQEKVKEGIKEQIVLLNVAHGVEDGPRNADEVLFLVVEHIPLQRVKVIAFQRFEADLSGELGVQLREGAGALPSDVRLRMLNCVLHARDLLALAVKPTEVLGPRS